MCLTSSKYGAEIHLGLKEGFPNRRDIGFLLPKVLTTNTHTEVPSDPHLLDYPDRLDFALQCGDQGHFVADLSRQKHLQLL